MTLPNFLIVGAAKSGTTSFNYYLKEHPQIFMSSVKEPYFFSTQGLKLPEKGPGDDKRKYVKDFSTYQDLFGCVKNEVAIGEASSDTLYNYKFTVGGIQKHLGDPKILIFLRNPADRAFSAYTHVLRENLEHCSFEEGLDLEKERISNNWNSLWHYRTAGYYSKQVEAFIAAFSQVKIFIYEDMIGDIRYSLQEIYEFLGVDTKFEASNVDTRYNVSGLPRSRTVNNFLNMKNPVQKFIKKIGTLILTEDRYVQLREVIRMRNIKKPEMSDKIRRALLKDYQSDILELEKILQKDLSFWLK